MKYSSKNKPLVCMMTNSTCYKNTKTMTVRGILWHSTGSNNNTVRRYVQPSDDASNRNELINKIGKNQYGNDWNHIYLDAGVNAFIGLLADNKTIATVQTLPWNYRPWGCGQGWRGSCNDGWIQFEICEDNLSDQNYFNEAYQEACELTAYLCDMYNLDPKGKVSFGGIQVPVILCHKDSNDLALGSAHGDVMHWFKKYNKTMDDVRNDVALLMKTAGTGETQTTPSSPQAPATPAEVYRIRKTWADSSSQKGAYTTLNAAKKALETFGSEYKVFNSSGKIVYELPVKITKPTYTTVSLAYANANEKGTLYNGTAGDSTKKEIYIRDWFNNTWTTLFRPKDSKVAEKIAYIAEDICLNDKIGYDISDRNTLYTNAKKVNFDITKITTACECDSGSLVTTCCVGAGLSESIFYAGNICRVTANFKAACESSKAFDIKTDKAYLSQKDYLKRGDILSNGSELVVVLSNGTKSNENPVTFKPYVVKITATVLNVRSGPGTSYKVNTTVRKNQGFTIVEEKNGWGKLKSGAGWISLAYTIKI